MELTSNNILYNKEGTKIGVVHITTVLGDVYIGKIEFLDFPKALLELFREYENIINLQVFSLLDKYQQEIEEWQLTLNSHKIADIQIMNNNDISFKLA